MARAARHGRPASAGDVCEIAVTAARVNGGWVTVAGGRVPTPDAMTDPVGGWPSSATRAGTLHDVQVLERRLGSDLEDAQSARWPVFA